MIFMQAHSSSWWAWVRARCLWCRVWVSPPRIALGGHSAPSCRLYSLLSLPTTWFITFKRHTYNYQNMHLSLKAPLLRHHLRLNHAEGLLHCWRLCYHLHLGDVRALGKLGDSWQLVLRVFDELLHQLFPHCDLVLIGLLLYAFELFLLS